MVSTSTTTGIPAWRARRAARAAAGASCPSTNSKRAHWIICGVDLVGLQAQALGTVPDHGALAGFAIHQNVGGLIRAARAHLDVVEIDAAGFETLQLNPAALIVAIVPIYFVRSPRRAHAARAPRPGRLGSLLHVGSGPFRLAEGNEEFRISVSVAFRPAPTTSNCGITRSMRPYRVITGGIS